MTRCEGSMVDVCSVRKGTGTKEPASRRKEIITRRELR